MPPASPEREVHSISALNYRLRMFLERQFAAVWVEGEVTGFKKYPSGHWYLTLKDSASQLQAIVPYGINIRLKFSLQDGMQVIARGRLTVYEPQGRHQLQIDAIEPKGIGAAELALRQLKEKLHAKGYFDKKRKRALHPYPRRVALVTSAKGAAIRDMLQLFSQRWPCCEVIVRPCRVQGDGAAEELAASMRLLSQLHLAKRLQFHAIIIGRGGGSTEDLMAFNEEVVADAIFHSSVPVISAVGHEIDVTIADHVADHRAETPSAAVTMAAPHRNEVIRRFAELGGNLREAMLHRIGMSKQRVDHLASRPVLRRPLQRFRDLEQRLDMASERLERAAKVRLAAASEKVAAIAAQLETLSPLNVLRRGYSLTHTADGKLIRDAAEVHPGDVIVTRLASGEVTSRVEPTS
ncbi:MAG TPA: exodeoxyribonuclease VII large subunit [Urbifossiella sp.]|jgi:exodeoxyribonuclease VII large subunit